MLLNTIPLLAPLLILPSPTLGRQSPGLPFVITTWSGSFSDANDAAFLALSKHPSRTSALDAVQIGLSTCEQLGCDGTVGRGGSPDESCETTLDALLMDGASLNIGAVAGLRRVRDAAAVARHVLDFTDHSLLAGDLATEFALQNGFIEEDLSTPESRARCEEWKRADCQPNYRRDVAPDPHASCGPYAPLGTTSSLLSRAPGVFLASQASHDTISQVTIHSNGTMAAGTSTNGASHKIPGRVGDGPIPGSGSYVDADVGGCGATGDGDIMMRFSPCYQAVENLRRGMTPEDAARDALFRIMRKYPNVSSGIIVVNNKGEHAGVGSGWTFTYSFRGGNMEETEVVTVPPLTAADLPQ